jgi:polysaccharide export outer membrane protein
MGSSRKPHERADVLEPKISIGRTAVVASCLNVAAIGAFAAILSISSPLAAEEYRLQPSDVIELSVAGIDSLNQKSQVDLDGNVVLPLAGQMRVEGKTLAEVRNEFNSHLTSTSFDQETSEGLKTYYIQPDRVMIRIAEYRPVYILGDVASPGEQRYRPGLTVRQAIAVAGGYDLMRFKADNPFVQSAALRAEYDSLWIEFANAQSTVARLSAELTGNQTLDRSGLSGLPVPEHLLEELAQSESEQLSLRQTELGNEKQHLQRLIDQSQNRFDLLTEEQAQVEEDRKADTQDMDRIRGLFDKGMATAARITEARQGLLNSSLRFLATAADLGSTTEDLEKFKREYDKVEPDRRLELLGELKEAKIKLAKTLSDLGAVSEKLLYVGSQRSNWTEGLAGQPQITIFRGDKNQEGGQAGGEVDMLEPGDLVQITLQPPEMTPPTGSVSAGEPIGLPPAPKVP